MVGPTALATRMERLAALRVEDVKTLLATGDATHDEIRQFILYCKAVDADPWAKEVYLIKYSQTDPAAIVLALNWYLKRASHNPLYETYQSGIIVCRNGEYVDVVGCTLYPGDQLFGGWCKVWKRGAKFPFERRIPVDTALRRRRDGQPMALWGKDPAMMVEVAAIRQGIRRAFPDEFAPEPMEVSLPVVVEGEIEEVPEAALPPPPAALPSAPQGGDLMCPIHNTPWFKKGRMQAYAHVIAGEEGPRGGKVWCDMEQVLREQASQEAEDAQEVPQEPLEEVSEPPHVGHSEAPQTGFSGKTLVDLWNYGLSLGFKSKAECLDALGLNDDSLIADLAGAASELVRAAAARDKSV